MDTCPSRQLVEIIRGGQQAIVANVGGGIRQYKAVDRPVLDPYQVRIRLPRRQSALAQRLDFPLTGLARDSGSRAWSRMRGPDGRHTELWVDESYPIIEFYTGDTVTPGPWQRRPGTEPMTCPPDAFRSVTA